MRLLKGVAVAGMLGFQTFLVFLILVHEILDHAAVPLRSFQWSNAEMLGFVVLCSLPWASLLMLSDFVNER